MNLISEKALFEEFLQQKSDLYFRPKTELNEAILYSLLASGKRIRPLLCMAFSHAFSGNKKVAMTCGMAVELIHAYSLIHDDLPAMDNDDYRRGRLTNHKVYGEALAILAGDSLLTFAPQFLIQELQTEKVSATKILDLTQMLLSSSGHSGMVLGQAMDMASEKTMNESHSPQKLGETLTQIHRLKTGSIITWSCLAGLYSADDAVIEKNKAAVKTLGEDIGLLFQIVDDILDVTATLNELGKTPGKDVAVGKLTYSNLYGISETKKLAHELIQKIRSQFNGADWKLVEEIVSGLEAKLS